MLIYNPRQMVLITCRGKYKIMGKEEEKDDILPLSWHSPVSSHPPMYAIFVQNNLMAVSIIRESKAFVVNFIPYSFVDKIKQAMGLSGEYTHKCETLGLHEAECEKIDCFKIKEALGWLECEVVEEKEYGDYVLFVARVLSSFLEREDKRPFPIEKDVFTTTR